MQPQVNYSPRLNTLGERPKLGRPTIVRPPSTTGDTLLTPQFNEPAAAAQKPVDDVSEEIQNNDSHPPSAGNFESSDPPNSEPELSETITQTTGPPTLPPFQSNRPTRDNKGVPHPKYADYHLYSAWSATRSELEEINNSITSRRLI